MMGAMSKELAEQYRDSSNLAARQRIYRFAQSNVPLGEWVMQRLDLPDGARVLELGCGHGVLWAKRPNWRDKGWRLVLTDLSEGMAREAHKELAAAGTVHVLTSDAQAIPLADRSVDGVVANHMLYHVPDRDRCFREVRRVLREGGKLFAVTNSFAHLRELKELFEPFVPGAMTNGMMDALEWFAMETGAAQLARHFKSVSESHVGGELRVKEAQAVVDYAMSIDQVRAQITETQLSALRAQVQRAIDRDGAFVVHTRLGMFTAAV
jgi:ubiquinone/menaquinone biosynthesis C-methylase UbiE